MSKLSILQSRVFGQRQFLNHAKNGVVLSDEQMSIWWSNYEVYFQEFIKLKNELINDPNKNFLYWKRLHRASKSGINIRGLADMLMTIRGHLMEMVKIGRELKDQIQILKISRQVSPQFQWKLDTFEARLREVIDELVQRSFVVVEQSHQIVFNGTAKRNFRLMAYFLLSDVFDRKFLS